MGTRVLIYGTVLALALADTARGNEPAADAPQQASRTTVDRSGRVLRGQAAIFASNLAGQTMADGGRYDPETSIAASSSLPLGSTARVTNLRNGQTAIVRVRDRLPGTNGRMLNVSAKVAQFLGVRRGGVFPVTVAPLAVPQADGGVQLGAGTGLAGRRAYVTGGHDRR
ncbi:septal ring lytic transglycosylase RlpA family protein [Paracraurococcus lichenis]|uniref:septal ring lytic transglycosylase RlpA family protein n=1 Tax=Paracraurococcus lichenis TaxID=3064888 RepID=UPI00351CBEF3